MEFIYFYSFFAMQKKKKIKSFHLGSLVFGYNEQMKNRQAKVY